MMIALYLSVLSFALSFSVHAGETRYSEHIQPIFTEKCVACHACYDSPCQLNLGSGEGLERGAHKQPVYNGGRTKAQQPTRLFIDAQQTQQWRDKGFFDVLSPGQPQASLLASMLELGKTQPFAANSRLPDDLVLGVTRKEECPAPSEFASYAQKHPHSGMPFAVTGLTDEQYATIQQWLAEGAEVDWQPWRANSAEQQQIDEWEAFLNRPGARETIVSRWLYEHLFLAHIHFKGAISIFFDSCVPIRQAVRQLSTLLRADPMIRLGLKCITVLCQ